MRVFWKCSANGTTVSRLAPMPLKTSSVRSASAGPIKRHAQALPRDVHGADVGRRQSAEPRHHAAARA